MSLYDPALSSRGLLRVALLKDDLNRSTASLPTMDANAMSRSSRHPSSSPVRPTTRAPALIPRRPHTAQPTPTRTRDHSRSPLSTPDHTQPQPQPHLVTPHEQVLRTRLERVLFSAGVADDITKRRERGRGTSPSARPALTATSLHPSTRTIKRNRSKTESNVPPPSSSYFPRLSPSPRTPHIHHPLSSLSRSESLVRQQKRISTPRSIASASGSLSGSGSGKRSGTTPPLVPDDDDGSGEGGEPRILLLTPPPTPSPPAFGFPHAAQWPYKSQCYRTEDDDDEDDDSCSSSYSSYRQGSSISSSALPSSVVRHLHTPVRTPSSPQSKTSPPIPHTPTRPFNARRASAQCRAMEGYISFANVEGLGVPPDDSGLSPSSPNPSQAKGVMTALGWGGGVVRKILGGGEKAEQVF